jgi:hypothetical protein
MTAQGRRAWNTPLEVVRVSQVTAFQRSPFNRSLMAVFEVVEGHRQVAGARQRLARMAAHEAGTGDENRHEISCGITDSEPAEPIRAELTSASKPPACANRYRTMS